MEYIYIPSIVIICFVFAEALKFVTNKNEIVKRLIPIILSIIGGTIGALIFIYYPDYIAVKTIFEAIAMGMISGLASTGSNQIVKQLLKGAKKDETEFFWGWI